jgi:hypothetical protein
MHGGFGCPSGPQDYRLDLGPAQTGKWNDFMFQIHFDRAGKGWLDAWMNGRQIVSHFVPPCGTIYPAPYANFTILRLGYYRDPAINTPGTIIHDEYRMGPTQASVALG